MGATRLTVWPLPVPDDLWAWATSWRDRVPQPDAAASESLDDHNVSWDRARRKDILDAARLAYSAASRPVYSFPDPDWH